MSYAGHLLSAISKGFTQNFVWSCHGAASISVTGSGAMSGPELSRLLGSWCRA
jgi:hypothetical protein